MNDKKTSSVVTTAFAFKAIKTPVLFSFSCTVFQLFQRNSIVMDTYCLNQSMACRQ